MVSARSSCFLAAAAVLVGDNLDGDTDPVVRTVRGVVGVADPAPLPLPLPRPAPPLRLGVEEPTIMISARERVGVGTSVSLTVRVFLDGEAIRID